MIRAARCPAAEVMPLLAAIPSAKTDSRGAIKLQDCIDAGMVFKITQDGETVAAYILTPLGNLLWITAFGGRAGFDLVAALAVLVEQQGGEFDAIGFRTERRGLVRKAMRHGYKVTRQEGAAYFLRKNLR
jgi:hypothetical protein